MSEYDNHEPSSEDQLLHIDLLMAEDASDFCAMVDEVVDEYEYDIMTLPKSQLEGVIEAIEEQLREELENSGGLKLGRPVGCYGFGAFMIADAEGNILEGKMLSTTEKLFGLVNDIRVKKVPIWPAIMAEGKGEWTYKEILSPCIVLKWPNITNITISRDYEDISDRYVLIPLAYGDIHFEALVGETKEKEI